MHQLEVAELALILALGEFAFFSGCGGSLCSLADGFWGVWAAYRHVVCCGLIRMHTARGRAGLDWYIRWEMVGLGDQEWNFKGIGEACGPKSVCSDLVV